MMWFPTNQHWSQDSKEVIQAHRNDGSAFYKASNARTAQVHEEVLHRTLDNPHEYQMVWISQPNCGKWQFSSLQDFYPRENERSLVHTTSVKGNKIRSKAYRKRVAIMQVCTFEDKRENQQ